MELIVFSHLRWNFVYQRPQHLVSRFVNLYRVFYVEEPVFTEQPDGYSCNEAPDKVQVITPHLNTADTGDHNMRMEAIAQQAFRDFEIKNYIFWYYSPMALLFTSSFKRTLIVYDCMDELSAFKFAPPILIDMENELMQKADIVFTGGKSLYEAKKNKHQNIYCFPSSIDKAHFNTARHTHIDPADQQNIPHPRLGFFGVVDERFDIDLVGELAVKKPEWQIVIIGPVVKIDEASLPRHANIHYLGMKSYGELPAYISTWDIAIMPFAINESTRYISPTKTPEYLAAGKQVISTRITDVVHPYAETGLVDIADTADEFIKYGEKILSNPDDAGWLAETDEFLADVSWDRTWEQMNKLIEEAIDIKNITNKLKPSQCTTT